MFNFQVNGLAKKISPCSPIVRRGRIWSSLFGIFPALVTVGKIDPELAGIGIFPSATWDREGADQRTVFSLVGSGELLGEELAALV